MVCRHFMILVLAAALGGADLPQPDLSTVQNELEGTWSVTSSRDVCWVFSQGKLEIFRGSNKVNEGTYRVDLSCEPHAIDLTILSSRYKYVGIFKITGSDLIFRDVNAAGAHRPTSFDSGPGNTLRFKRVK